MSTEYEQVLGERAEQYTTEQIMYYLQEHLVDMGFERTTTEAAILFVTDGGIKK